MEPTMDVQPLLQAFLLLLAFPALLVLILRVIGPGDSGAPSLFASDTDPGWPRGVQEEEPTRYRLELIGPRRRPRSLSGREPSGAPAVQRIEQRA
jgi:hypothetical protein